MQAPWQHNFKPSPRSIIFKKPREGERQGEGTGSQRGRPGGDGGWLRAFRRAEVIVDAVLFESCVGGVAVAMTVASIFHFEFWFLWGIGLGAFLGAFWRALWVLRVSLGML